MQRYRRVHSSPGMLTPLSQESQEYPSDIVVQATLHNCAQSIKNGLNFENIHFQLAQDRILPLASDNELMRIMPPDTSERQANNLVIWLRRATREQFEQFIVTLRESGAGDGGRPHEELAAELENEYGKLKDDPDLAKELADDFVTNPEFSYFFPIIPPAAILQDPFYACGYRIWELCCCKGWLFVYLGFGVLAMIACIITHFLVPHHLPRVESNDVTPKQVSGTSNVVVDLGRNLHFVVSVTITVNCPGSGFVREDSDCRVLNETTTSVTSSLDLSRPSVHYLIDGSNLSLRYISNGDDEIGNSFIVVKSLEYYNKYVQLCFEVLKRNCTRSDGKLVKKLCLDQGSEFATWPNASKGYFACFRAWKVWFTYSVEKSDFYYFSIPLAYPFSNYLKTVSYNTSLFPELGFKEYPFQNSSAGNYSVKLPITSNSLKPPNSCIVLSTNCATGRHVYSVSYEFQYTKVLYYALAIVFSVVAAILVLIHVCCFCCWRKKEQVAEETIEDETEDQ